MSPTNMQLYELTEFQSFTKPDDILIDNLEPFASSSYKLLLLF